MKTLLLWGALLLVSTLAMGQTPQWTVVVTPTMNPLPLGMCGAVHLTLMDPVTRDVPRNPQGDRINMADFDMTVSGGISAAGHYLDASHFQACGCQGGAAGSTATVTATYPAQSLPAAKRVPGVSFQQSANFVLALPKGTVNPHSCVTLASTNGSSTTTPIGSRTPASTSAAGPAPAAPAAPTPTPTPTTDPRAANNTAPVAISPAGTRVPPANSTTPPAAPVATGGATPMANQPIATAPPATRTPGAVVPTTPAPAAAAPVPVNPDPKFATAVQRAGTDVLLMWDQVPDASFYVVFGPGLTPGGHRVENTTKLFSIYNISRMNVQVEVANLPSGTHEWLVASYYSPGNVSTSSAEYTRLTVTINAPATNPPAAAAPTPTPAPATSGKYLVTATGFRAYQTSMDDPLSRDGVGDEVYAAVYVRRYDQRTGQLADASMRQSAVQGDVFHFGGQRLQAGTKSQFGGIQDGDPIPDGPIAAIRSGAAQDTTFPLRLWEGTLTDGIDTLILSPSLWEQDGSDSYYSQWAQHQQSLNLSFYAKPGVQTEMTQKTFRPIVFGMSGNSSNDVTLAFHRIYSDIGMVFGGGLPIVSLLSTSADRPLGLVASGVERTALPNHTVVLTREIIEAALAKAPLGAIPSPLANSINMPAIVRMGVVAPVPGILVLHFHDDTAAAGVIFPERSAIYQMYIQVERVP